MWLTLLSQVAARRQRHRRLGAASGCSPPCSPAPALVGALAPPRPPGRGVEGAAQPAPLVAAAARWPCSRLYAGAGRRRRRSCPALAVAAAVVGAAGVYASARLYVVPGRPAWDTPLTIVRFFATALGARPAAHRARARSPPPGGGVALAATAANWLRLRAATEPAVAGRGPPRAALVPAAGRCCAGSPASPAPSLAARPARPLAAFVLLAVGELIGRWLFYVTVVPLNMPGSFWRGTAGSHAMTRSAGPGPGSRRLLGVDHGGDRYTLRRRAGPRPGQRQPRRRPLGPHDVRLLLGRLRDAPRRARRPGRRRAGRPRPSRQPRAGCARRACPSTTRSRADGRLDDAARRRPPGDVGRRARPGRRRVPRAARRARPRVGRRAVDRPARDRGVLRARQARAPRHGPAPLRRQHHAVHGAARCPATSSASAPTARRAATTTSSSPTSSCCGAPTSPTTTRCSRRACSAAGPPRSSSSTPA